MSEKQLDTVEDYNREILRLVQERHAISDALVRVRKAVNDAQHARRHGDVSRLLDERARLMEADRKADAAANEMKARRAALIGLDRDHLAFIRAYTEAVREKYGQAEADALHERALTIMAAHPERQRRAESGSALPPLASVPGVRRRKDERP